MTLQFEALQSALDGDSSAGSRLTGPHRRLRDAWESHYPGEKIAADIAALVAQVLRHERDVESIQTPHLRLRLDERSIDTSVLAISNLDCHRYGKTEHLVTLRDRWHPEWLQGDPRWIDVACASPGVYRGGTPEEVSTYARPDNPVPADPALTAIAPAIMQYRSRTQATAIRTATLGDPASTLHVVLPTGTGKSIVGLAPSLLRAGGNAVVVVPTIALALDQERALHQLFSGVNLPRELAYYGDRSDGGKEAIRQRLRAGTQRVVFTSPEALTSGLAPTLHALAATGKLSSIVIDEAHLVRSWGLDFRPEYQLVSALISELRAIATASGKPEPHVILLTATLSEEGLELNDALFHGVKESTFVGSTFLRTELRYLMAASRSREERLERLVEAMRHLPRPAIIYVSRKADAVEITARLKDAGFNRTDFFHGDVREEKRLGILKGWSGSSGPTQLDIVVGTSAFGLGIDQSDVRTVVHACVPASVDRFYQEVGRAGRDGHAALSVWLTAPGDVTDGRSIEGSTLIGATKTWNRWEAMRLRSVPVELNPGLLVLDTSVVPHHVTQASDANRLWNRNTLTLMERAGLIAVEASPPPEIQQNIDENAADFEARRRTTWEKFRNEVRVRIDPGLSLDQFTFEARLQQLRAAIRATEKASHARIDELLSGSECWAGIIGSEYTLRNVGPMRVSLRVTPACSGCPAEQHKHRPRYDAPLPLVSDAGIPELSRDVSAALKELSAGSKVIVVTYSGSLRLSLQDLVQRCVVNGVRGILTSRSLAGHSALTATASRATEDGLVWVDTIAKGLPTTSFAAPTLILLDESDRPNLSWLNPSSGPLRILVVPESADDPEKPGHKIMDYRSPHWGMHDFLRRI